MLTKKDICLVIPTYNRAEDVERTIKTLIKNNNVPGKIIIVDQSKDNKTREIVKNYKNKLPIKYVFSSVPSSSMAENMGVDEGKEIYSLLLIAGDDTDFLPNYMSEMAKTFNKNPKAKGVGGININDNTRTNKESRLANFILKLFFLPYEKDHKFNISGPYGYTNCLRINKIIKDAEWIPGFNNCFRKEIYYKYRFPEIRGYNVLEDIDCSYNVFRNYGPGSLIITPKCRVLHRESKVARYPERKRIFVNHEDHFSFYYKHFYNKIGILKMIWSISGIISGNFVRFIASPSKEGFQNWRNNMDAILFCYKNRKKIKIGKYRTFLNEDLSMKEEYL